MKVVHQFAVVVMCAALLAGCKSKQEAAPAADEPAAKEAPAAKDEPSADEPAPKEPPAAEETLAGLFPVRASDTDPDKLDPAEGDHVHKAKAADGTWHMVGLDEGVGVDQVAKVTKSEPTGGVQYQLTLNDDGKQRLAEMTRKNVGKRIAFVVDNAVLMAPEVKTAIESGVITINCGSQERACIDYFEKLAASTAK